MNHLSFNTLRLFLSLPFLVDGGDDQSIIDNRGVANLYHAQQSGYAEMVELMEGST